MPNAKCIKKNKSVYLCVCLRACLFLLDTDGVFMS